MRGIPSREPNGALARVAGVGHDDLPALPIKLGRPILHEPPPSLEQIRPRVGGLDLVLDHVAERRLNDFTRMNRFLGGPIRERRPEAVRHGGDLVVLEHLREHRRGYRPPAPHREHEPVAVTERPRGVEDLQRPTSVELYDALRADNPTSRQRSIATVLINEASFDDLVNAHTEGAFTWRQLTRAAQREGAVPPPRIRLINAFATPPPRPEKRWRT